MYLCLRKKAVFTLLGIVIAVLRNSWIQQRESPMKDKMSVIVLAVAICLILFGMVRGEVFTVLDKGTNLCLECVGIG